ncbi:hypothetical protein BDZ85DRAFT_284007 [Elsinoe ampelina]|uniref:Uncharacterized protein n=1 Tax=Elsinoe ampelina TaxID=302913 RepID=A0A6A6G5U1_9PEZI|nr:hypothetical protein BDZ85DRAFT_284007 [Elsinoe ampelina]
MEVDPPTPTSPLRRKRTFHDLSDATSSLALQTPNPEAQDPHYGDGYFSNTNDLTANPFALSTLGNGGTPGTAANRSERSISPSKRLRVLAHRSRPASGDDDGPASPSPLSRSQETDGLGISRAAGSAVKAIPDTPMNVSMAAEDSTASPLSAMTPGRVIPLEQCTTKFDAPSLLKSFVTDQISNGPTANWSNANWESAVLLYVCPTWREDFGRGSGGYVSHLDGIGGLGMGFEGLCVAVHTILSSMSQSTQAMAVSDRLDLPLQASPPVNHMQELTSVLPVRRAPEATTYLLQAATHLLRAPPDSSIFSDGLLVLIDHQSNIRLVLPMSETRNVAVTASTSGSISVARRKAISAALEGVLKDALQYLEEEKAWLRGQR